MNYFVKIVFILIVFFIIVGNSGDSVVFENVKYSVKISFMMKLV